MAHQALYRRYRSQRFSEVKGQEQVTTALRSAVAEGRVGHAYLFSGPRGTGKTSTARILAKALNCEDLQDGEPCGVCAACVSMQAGTSYDLQELDAASKSKVEDVRTLIESVALGSPGRTKVYILDEVHMLSTGASNALLKTLEEPPDHVVFVLATTDPQKVLPTIRSRTQHFEFHLLPADVLADHVRWVIADAGLDVDEADVEHVLRAGGGSARDTLSALDQAVAGGVSTEGDHAEALAAALVAVDTAAALSAVATATAAGRDPRVLGEALLAHLRDVFLHRMGGPLGHLSEPALARVEGWSAQVTDRQATRALEEVGEALLAMRQAPDPRIPLEVALVRLTRSAPAGGDGGAALDDLEARVARLERGAPAPSADTAARRPTPRRPTPRRPTPPHRRPRTPPGRRTRRPRPRPTRPRRPPVGPVPPRAGRRPGPRWPAAARPRRRPHPLPRALPRRPRRRPPRPAGPRPRPHPRPGPPPPPPLPSRPHRPSPTRRPRHRRRPRRRPLRRSPPRPLRPSLAPPRPTRPARRRPRHPPRPTPSGCGPTTWCPA
ncbi:DNA polymerase III subunit gamma/tau [Iamia majanohamensis]|uniref:DNA polymerase III subunit gamma/tau n=1 Tax=Iamia majanohamensis TaxID=467976 RepID=A0AAE9Y7X6_9ACTN|nr:DNA polymerase III subunit gamma/tau [Iamia majanohamensis]WCO67351.1 DNA polymerase III subunit gamma/tau [Iamia majanohamensis]